MFDPAVLGTLLIGLDSARKDARPTPPRRDPAGAIWEEPSPSGDRYPIGTARDSVARRLGTLSAALLSRRTGAEHQPR
jgi:hypothetical protein